jgi:cell division protein FtsQ
VKRTLWLALAALAIAAYLVFALIWTGTQASHAVCQGIDIEITDTVGHGFVTTREIANELGPWNNAPSRTLDSIDIDSMERLLNTIDKIENVSVTRTTDSRIHLRVNPMHPVARVWDSGRSYYINREGKRITANARYHTDVPVITGTFDSVFQPTALLPLIDYIEADSTWSSLITMIKTDRRHNVILIPMIRGHVINFGSIANIPDKFSRLHRMYTEVLPVKGWNYYDTLSVKWDGQVVATRRHNKLPAPAVIVDDGSDDDVGDIGTMLIDTDDGKQSQKTQKTKP